MASPAVPAEAVAAATAKAVRQYLASHAAVGPHLADQLLLPMALGAGGRLLTVEPTPAHPAPTSRSSRPSRHPDREVTRHTGRSVLVTVDGRTSKEAA